MTKTIITPENNTVLLRVPEKYVGKQVEVLMYTVEEADDTTHNGVTMAEFEGVITKEEGQRLQEHIKKSREEWDRNI